MFIKEIFSAKRPVISFEIFPPKKDGPVDTVYSTIEALKDLKPDFVSVTYGAGGTATNRTVEIASLLKHNCGVEALAHLTCINSTREEIEATLKDLRTNGIENILALRGDLPQEAGCKLPDPLHYRFAKDLIDTIRHYGGFCIGAACYPEGHLECDDLQADLDYLKEKVDCGVDFLITQLFFDNEIFYRFRDRMAKNSIDIPVTAGILPVLNRKQIERIMSLCRATLPQKFIRIMERYEHNPEALREAGIAYATEQIVDLLSWGVDGIHIYTMNRPEVTRKIIGNVSAIREFICQ